MNKNNMIAIERELLGFDWGKLRRVGYANKLLEVIGERYAFRAIKPMPLSAFICDDMDKAVRLTADLTYAAEFSFVLEHHWRDGAFELHGFIQPSRFAGDYYPGTSPLKVESLRFTYEQFSELYEQSWAPEYDDHNYTHPFEHFAQLVIDKTFGVKRHEQSTATFGPERATNGVIRWSGVLENREAGGHCNLLPMA